MTWFCEAMLDIIFEADAIKDMRECIPIRFAVGERDAIVGEESMDCIRHSSEKVAQELCRFHLSVLLLQLGIRERAGTVDRNKQREFSFLCSHFGNIEVEVADRILLELLLGRFFLRPWAVCQSGVVPVSSGDLDNEYAMIDSTQCLCPLAQC